MRALDVAGERYGRLVAVRRSASSDRYTRWLFACDCGNEVETGLDPVRRGRTRSCGCLRTDELIERSETHGHGKGFVKTKTYRAWLHAKGRCFNPKDHKFPQYGGRGIKMCARWRDSFENFLADMRECPADKSLDRLDPHKGYDPANCRWASDAEQARTRTDNVIVRHKGVDLVLKDFAAAVGVNYQTLHARMKRYGETAQRAAAALSS